MISGPKRTGVAAGNLEPSAAESFNLYVYMSKMLLIPIPLKILLAPLCSTRNFSLPHSIYLPLEYNGKKTLTGGGHQQK